MDVEPKIGGDEIPPKWMVKIMENPMKMDDLRVALFLETPIFHLSLKSILPSSVLIVSSTMSPLMGGRSKQPPCCFGCTQTLADRAIFR